MSISSPVAAEDRAARHERILARAQAENVGPRDWRMWKQAAAQALVDLANASPRMELLDLRLEGEFNAIYRIAMPVPRWPTGNELRIGEEAVFDLVYDESWRRVAPPPTMPLGLFFPPDVFHPNCRPALMPLPFAPRMFNNLPRVSVCLGAMAPNIAVKELVRIGHDVISLQTRMMDETDPQGVFNPFASEYFRQLPEDEVPLYRLGLLEPWTPGEAA